MAHQPGTAAQCVPPYQLPGFQKKKIIRSSRIGSFGNGYFRDLYAILIIGEPEQYV
jgi:hypothetical protein